MTHPVGKKKANELGIFDMSGNVLEWCNDWYSENFYSVSPKDNPKGPMPTGEYRVVRGGSWSNNENNCRVAYRYNVIPLNRVNSFGFRVVRTY
jgi:formylglycine-generating enzyme required for sulfatase activity